MSIWDEVISLKGSTLQDRLRLQQVLNDNGYRLSNYAYNILIKSSNESVIHSTILGNTDNQSTDWTLVREYSNNLISYKKFIDKYRMSDEVRGLAFTKGSKEPWTDEEFTKIADFCGDDVSSHAFGLLDDLKGSRTRPIFDSEADAGFMHAWNKDVPRDLLSLVYEDVFPKNEGIKTPNTMSTVKFMPEDRVWFMYSNKAIEGQVLSTCITIDGIQSNIKSKDIATLIIAEADMFKTKQELLSSL